jgi:magnesium chelatase family protein
MVIHIKSAAFSGVDLIDVDVQVQLSAGMPQFVIVGLADKAVAESKERVRAAISSLGIALPSQKILVNLSPADLAKEGSHYDLPIALGVMAAMGLIDRMAISEYLIMGELSLDGTILPVSGILPASMGAVARNLGLICPFKNGREAAWSGSDDILPAKNLLSVVNHFKGTQLITKPEIEIDDSEPSYPDFSDVAGQDFAKKGLEIAAAGGHNVLMCGPPGTGKSMLASRMVGILPEMDAKEVLECSTIYSIAGLLESGKLSKRRPFRAPHHTCSQPALVGGGMGKRIKPGEISLAHNGVLFLDELPEFSQTVIESLRQPLETKEVLISRAGSFVKFSANFQLIAAMNPCRCGYFPDEEKICSKAPRCASDYMMKISGPMLDRFDINIQVDNIDAHVFTQSRAVKSESSKDILERVKIARKIQEERYEGYGIKTNNRIEGSLITDFAMPQGEALDILNRAATKYKMSMRGYNRILKVARTIADLDESKNISKIHISEAIAMRNPEGKYV